MPKTEDFFKINKNKIGWISADFKEHFSSMSFTIPKKLKLETRILEKPMLDKDILEQWKPKESMLGELAWALKNDSILLKNGYANIFYIQDKRYVLWAVRTYWDSMNREWYFDTSPFSYPHPWNAGHQVLSQAFPASSQSNLKNIKRSC